MCRISRFFDYTAIEVSKVQTFREGIECSGLLQHRHVTAGDFVLSQSVCNHVFDRRQDNRRIIANRELEAPRLVRAPIKIAT